VAGQGSGSGSAPDEANVLELERLTVELPAGADRRHAIEDVSLRVAAREILCLVGESGSGKSVTAHSIMGLLPKGQLRPVAGRIRLQGEDLLRLSETRLRDLRGTRMAMIFQEPMTALNPVMSCGAQIDEVLAAHTRLDPSARLERILKVMAEVQLPEPAALVHAYPHQLSGGQRQRIMIAMALVLEPALLIADEPTTALDVTTQAQILHLIKTLQREHATAVLFITHDFGVVAEIADRVAVMQAGRVVELGATGQVLREPRHAYTRMLIGAVPSLAPRERPRVAEATTVLRTEELTKVYRSGWFGARREVRAADRVSIAVRRGETLGIVGESGSGKSTVARCIARLIDPSAGEIFLDEQPIGRLGRRRLHPLRRRVQIVFQDPYRSLNPRRTIGASILEGPMNYGLSRSAALDRARSLMALVNLDPEALGRFPHQFSGGQRQRICIARALAMEPDLLIADEAVSALDVSVQAQVLALLEDIRKRLELAMLFITHDLRVAAQVCDTIAVMHQGRVVEYGPVGEVFAHPRDDYTRSLFAAAPGKDWDFGRFRAA
jgi:peptide/nickel transport system ATP-binding protein